MTLREKVALALGLDADSRFRRCYPVGCRVRFDYGSGRLPEGTIVAHVAGCLAIVDSDEVGLSMVTDPRFENKRKP